MTDEEHAKKYAEESISLATSMYNPMAEKIAEFACLYGLTYKNERIAELKKENADLQHKVDTLQGFLDRDVEFDNLQKENAELKEQVKEWKALQELYGGKAFKWQGKYGDVNKQLTKAKEIVKEFVEWANWQGNSKCPSFKSIQDKAEQFLNSEVEK